MYSKRALATWAVLGLIAVTSGARADTNTSVTDANPDWTKRLSEKTALSYFGVYRGAAVNGLGNSLQPADDGTLDPKSPQSLESYITTGYRLDKDLMIGVINHFYYSPIGMPDAGNKPFELLDPSLVLSRANLIKQGPLTVKGLLTLALPMSPYDYSRKHGDITTVSPTFILNYDVPNTRLSLGTYSFVTAYVPGSDVLPESRTYKLVVAPNASYQMTKTVAATLWVDLIQVTRKQGTGFISGMSNPNMDIEPGINWEIVPNLNFNPMFNIYPSNLTLAATSVQAVITGKVF